MRLQEVIRRPLGKAMLLGIVVAVGAYVWVFNSPQYQVARKLINSDAVGDLSGPIRVAILTSSRVTSQESRYSTFSFYVWGERESGLVELRVANGLTGPELKSAQFRDRPIVRGTWPN